MTIDFIVIYLKFYMFTFMFSNVAYGENNLYLLVMMIIFTLNLVSYSTPLQFFFFMLFLLII